MAILASREHTCVHPVVMKSKNKSEGCRERLDAHVGVMGKEKQQMCISNAKYFV